MESNKFFFFVAQLIMLVKTSQKGWRPCGSMFFLFPGLVGYVSIPWRGKTTSVSTYVLSHLAVLDPEIKVVGTAYFPY